MRPLFILVFLFSVGFCHAQAGLVPADWKTFRDTTGVYTMEYPPAWDARRIEGAMFFRSPKSDKHDVFLENVNVLLEDMTKQPMTLDAYAELSRKQINTMGGVSKVLSEKKITFAGQPAYEMVYDFTYDGSATKVKTVFFQLDKWMYQLSYTALPETFDEYEAPATQVIYSFRLLKP